MAHTGGLQIDLHSLAAGVHVPLWVEVLVLVATAIAIIAALLIFARSRR